MQIYFVRSILFFINTGVSKHILMLDTFIFVKDNMDWREYYSRKRSDLNMDVSTHKMWLDSYLDKTESLDLERR
jgi:hypothetical protein